MRRLGNGNDYVEVRRLGSGKDERSGDLDEGKTRSEEISALEAGKN